MAIFKRWSRKGFAIFNSLKSEIKIAVLNVNMHQNAPVLRVETSVVNYLFDQDDDDKESNEDFDLLTTMVAIHSLDEVGSSDFTLVFDLFKDTLCSTIFNLSKLTRFPIPQFSRIILNDIPYRMGSLCLFHKSKKYYYAD
ncbi:hypothetical protein [Flammeovirga pacifica]|uniref:Uncharacterized protein n=1 Tax=Flammeovirga pacifica TaxID=915059 RepID=A0A1S1YW16_FLAPC|nr:hypothetical protein [Flammeovirga pacifica]OHX64995.1 hypothetical protein NH26_00835 [Flammeovirga pacifica]